MNRIIALTILSFGIAGFASAQTTKLSSANSHTAKAHILRGTGAKHKKKATPAKISKPVTHKTTALDNRKNYNWSNGQSSTPTGKDATSINGGYSSLEKDAATKAKVKKH